MFAQEKRNENQEKAVIAVINHFLSFLKPKNVCDAPQSGQFPSLSLLR
jgi:hypothetical protein